MGANFAARRSLFERAGTFDEILGGGGPLKSSQDLTWRIALTVTNAAILLRPEVIVHDGRHEREQPALLTAYGFGDGAFIQACALQTPTRCVAGGKSFGVSSARFVFKRASAVAQKSIAFRVRSGSAEGSSSVDRATLLYTEKTEGDPLGQEDR
jgi:hypothetical protein